MKSLFAPLIGLICSVAIILFSSWYLINYSDFKLYKSAKGIPARYGLKAFDPEKGHAYSDLSYLIQLKDDTNGFVLRMYGEDFSVQGLESALRARKEIEIVYHPLPNEHKEFEVYTITQNGKLIYTFNKKFKSENSRALGWFMLVTGLVILVFSCSSFLIRRKNHRTS